MSRRMDTSIKQLTDHCRKEKVHDQVSRSRARGEIRSTNANTKSKRSGDRDVDYVTTNASSSQFEAQLYILKTMKQ